MTSHAVHEREPLILGNEKIDGSDVNGVQQRNIDNIIRFGHRPKLLLQLRARRLPNISKLLEFS